MQYRDFPNIDFRPSALGFGCMRLPTRGSESEIDEPLAIEMIRHAIDNGVNYVDTAHPYHGGNSELLVAKALADGYREKVALADKMPVWLVNATKDLDTLFDEQRRKLKSDKIDFYLLHCLQKGSWARMREVGALEWLERTKEKGYIGEIGFSFHDTLDVFRDIVDGYGGWSFCQIQHNFLHVEVQAGTAGLRHAAARGLGIIIMEPLFGGALAQTPGKVSELWERAARKRTPVDWALQWLWSQPEVSLVLSGMTTMEHVRENLESASASRIGLLSEQELELVDLVREEYKSLQAIPCSRCGYCLPCPDGVDIPRNFELYNDAAHFGGNAFKLNSVLYQSLPAAERAASCRECGECEEKCPQKIRIREWLPKVDRKLTGK